MEYVYNLGIAVASDGQLFGWSREGRCRLTGQTSRQRKLTKPQQTNKKDKTQNQQIHVSRQTPRLLLIILDERHNSWT